MQFFDDNGALVAKNNGETLRIEAWGKDGLRVRATMLPKFTDHTWALSETPSVTKGDVKLYQAEQRTGDGVFSYASEASIQNGRVKIVVNMVGIISIYRDDELLLREYFRSYGGTISKESRCLKIVNRDWGGGYLHTGQPNELWSYGEDNYRIMRHYYDIRISMHDYIKSLYKEASENGSPLIRPMFYEFPDDEKCWELQDQYMFGDKYLVAPIFKLNQFEREVYLPAGKWALTSDGKVYEGGQTVKVAAPIEYSPVFERV